MSGCQACLRSLPCFALPLPCPTLPCLQAAHALAVALASAQSQALEAAAAEGAGGGDPAALAASSMRLKDLQVVQVVCW